MWTAGPLELMVIVPIVLIYMGIPITTLVTVILMYGKVKRIEEKLDRRE